MVTQAALANEATHWIVGAGQIGSFLAANFQLSGQRVKTVARGQWKDRLSNGFSFTDLNGYKEQIMPVEVYDDIQSMNIQPNDWVWLTVKCTALVEACEQLVSNLHDSNTVVLCQNGVGAHEQAHNLFSRASLPCVILSAMVPFNVVWHEGKLHRGSEGTVTIQMPENEEKQAFIATLESRTLPLAMSNDIESVLWAKLQLNVGNAVNALADLPVKKMLQNRYYRRVMADAMEELLIVCQTQGRVLPKVARLHGRYLPFILRLPNWLFQLLARQMLAIDPTVKTSMWWDFHQGKPTEIEFLQGAVIKEGLKNNIVTPVNEWLQNEIIKQSNSENPVTAVSGKQMWEKCKAFASNTL